MDISFEKAFIADAVDLLDVQIRAFHDDARLYPNVEMGGPPGYDSIQRMMEDIEQVICYKMVHANKIVGGIVIFDRGEGHYHLDRIFVDPHYHNLGFGTQAMQFIESVHLGRIWTLDTPLYAIRNQHFYEKLGYINVGEDADDDIQLICYEKKL